MTALTQSCVDDKADVIPMAEFSSLLDELYLVDQYVESCPSLRIMADSLCVYQEFIERRGYTVEQFIASFDEYTASSKELAQMFSDMLKKYEGREADAQRLIDSQNSAASLGTLFRSAGFNPMFAMDSVPAFDRSFIIRFMDSLMAARSFNPDVAHETEAGIAAIEGTDTLPVLQKAVRISDDALPAGAVDTLKARRGRQAGRQASEL